MAALSAPGTGPLRHQCHLELHVGGAESNVAIAVARLGGAAAWIGRVGDPARRRRRRPARRPRSRGGRPGC
ncbi:MAG: PfkB family carbohydrate kinase [Kineosporiaceae bacterium]